MRRRLPDMVRAVVFDVGETLIDDTREWCRWAQWLGARQHTLSALVGLVTAQGRDNADALRLLRPGFDMATERAKREAAGQGEELTDEDLYPDVRPALKALRDGGLWVGIAGNQTTRAAELLRSLDLPADAIATSGEWDVAKPDHAFFHRLIRWVPTDANEIVYVGDHRDNDVIPANSVGLRTAFIRRGPWGHLWADDPSVTNIADWCIDDLTELPALLLGA
jgi:HAD superfamily hydrolase (TIGR01549 family)